ncbi:MAG: GAF domain-containing protein [Anaerolineae bacterium]|nr:GAF domain-containing protein [Anaerolineae bacterium]
MSFVPFLNAKRILLVEENPSVVEGWKTLLRSNGYEVESAYNCGDALAAHHERYVLAIVNPNMRHRDGRSIFDHIREHQSFSRLPILRTTELGGTSAQILATIARRLESGHKVLTAQAARTTTTASVHETQSADSVGDLNSEDPTIRTRTINEQRKQLAALRTLSELGRSIAAVLDLDKVLNQVVEAAATLTNAEESLLLLPDPEEKVLYLRAMKGMDEARASNFRIKNTEQLVSNVFRNGEPAMVCGSPQRLKTKYFVRSAVYVPMRLKGKVIGVLGVNNRRSDRSFSQTDQELLLDLAAHAAVAIENARLYQERVVQTRRLETLVEAGMAVNSTLALQQVLLTIARQILKAVEASACSIHQRHSTADIQRTGRLGDTALLAESQLFVLSQAWQAVWQPENALRISLEARPMLRQAFEQNGYYIVMHSHDSAHLSAELQTLRQAGASCMTALPLRTSAGKLFGVVDLFYRSQAPTKGVLNAKQRAHIRSLSAEIYKHLSPSTNARTVSYKMAERPSPRLFALAQQILEVAQADWLVLSLLTENDQLMRVLQYGTAEFVEPPRPEESCIPIEILPIFQGQNWVNYHTRQNDLSEPLRNLMDSYGAQSILCLPLTIKGKINGMFVICDTYEPRVFHSDEISLATALIAQAATAIENAQLYRDLQQSLANLKQTQASLVQAARLSTIGELAAVVAHQINNPLTTVLADSELLLQDLPEGSPARESALAINRAGQRAHAVVKRLLSTARRGNFEEKVWVDVHQTIRNTLDLVSTHLGRGGVRFEVRLATEPPSYIRAPGGHLEDVWLNLLMNARDALNNRPDPAMGITSRRLQDRLDVSVWDNGCGIPSELRERIFEPFFTTKPSGEGTGLGLYICKQIITQIGGRISVESTVGQVTVFRVSLPVSISPQD